MPKRVIREKIYTKRRRGRPKVRWLDDVQEDLWAMGTEGWRRKTRNTDLWRRIAQEAKAHEGLYSQVAVVGRYITFAYVKESFDRPRNKRPFL